MCSLFRSKRPTIPGHVSDDLSQILRIRDDIHMSEHFEIGKIVCDPLLFERSDKRMIGIQIGDNLETSFERDDLSLEVSL